MKLLTQLCNLYLLNIRWIIILIIINHFITAHLFFFIRFFLPFYEFISPYTIQKNLASLVRINIIFFFFYFNYPRRRGTPIFAFQIGESAFELFSQMSRDIFFWRSHKKPGGKYLLQLDVRRDAPRLCFVPQTISTRASRYLFSLSMHTYSSVASI